MKYLSVCSGIEAATTAWHPLGWEAVGFSEIEPFPSQVLAHHYPNIKNYGDMTKHEEWDIKPGSIDLLVGGTPCQSFSVAGLRQGLKDPRGNLSLTYLAIAARLRPRWIVWENVPGVLSSSGGRDLASFLGALGNLGYGWAYRVLDAQWVRSNRHSHAVPQRRRRVFVVGCLGDATAAAKVLFERESVQRHSAKSGAAREEIAGTLAARSGECHNNPKQLVAVYTKAKRAQSDTDDETWVEGKVNPTLSLFDCGDVRATTVAIQGSMIGRQDHNGPAGSGCSGDGEMFTLTSTDVHAVAQAIPLDLRNSQRDPEKHDAQNRQGLGIGSVGDPAPTVDASFVHGVAHAFYSTDGTHGLNQQPEVCPAIKVGSSIGIPSLPAVVQGMTVRRLTPRECERLQGFPDDYTLIPWRKKAAGDCPDGPRYKALGNSMAVNCMEWIGERIAAFEAAE